MGRDNGPIALVSGNKGRSKALESLPRNVLRTTRKRPLEEFESVITIRITKTLRSVGGAEATVLLPK